MYKVYILNCSDGSLYTWIAKDLEKRLDQHNWILPGGAKYTSSRRPVKLVYFEEYENRSLASKREYEIKKLSRIEKIKMIWENKLI